MTSQKTFSKGQEFAHSIISLYDFKTENTDELIDELYSSDAFFRDPFVEVKGIENIKAQFRSLSKMGGRSKVSLNRGSFQGNCLTIDANAIYTFKYIPFFRLKLRMFIVLMIRDSKIVEHSDYWDVKTLLQGIPLFSFIYDKFRPAIGAISSAAIKKMWPSTTDKQCTLIAKEE